MPTRRRVSKLLYGAAYSDTCVYGSETDCGPQAISPVPSYDLIYIERKQTQSTEEPENLENTDCLATLIFEQSCLLPFVISPGSSYTGVGGPRYQWGQHKNQGRDDGNNCRDIRWVIPCITIAVTV